MEDNFQQTVDLKRKKIQQNSKRKAEQLEKIYKEKDGADKPQMFERAKQSNINEAVVKKVVIVLALLIIFFVVYFFVFKDESSQEMVEEGTLNWYTVKLVNDEIYYGQIEDTGADPIVIKNVYYNYKQGTGDDKGDETGNLRLVKRGKETHGPDGTMDLVRAQVLYMEPMREESKILKAILDYEE